MNDNNEYYDDKLNLFRNPVGTKSFQKVLESDNQYSL